MIKSEKKKLNKITSNLSDVKDILEQVLPENEQSREYEKMSEALETLSDSIDKLISLDDWDTNYRKNRKLKTKGVKND